MTTQIDIIRTIAKRFPAVVPHLRGRARWAVFAFKGAPETKTVDFYRRALLGLIRSVYNNLMGGEFVDIMANLVQGQLTQAFQAALDEVGADWFPELEAELQSMILNEYTFVDQFFRDIIDARLAETSIDPLLARADLWANRWNDAFNLAKLLIQSQFGERLQWVYGVAEHCPECQSLNGIVAFASEWEELGVRPQNPPNPYLTCNGWKCKCSLVPTNQRRTAKAYTLIMNIVSK